MPESRGRRYTRWYLVCFAALAGCILLSLCLGSKLLSPAELWDVALGSASSGDQRIVWVLRLERTVTGIVVGAALGASGAIMQSVIRNPIADPGILGINAGAALGVACGIMLTGSAGMLASVGFGLVGAACVAAFLLLCAMLPVFRGSAVRLTLCGVALSALLAGITQLLMFSDEKLMDQFRFWQVGSLAARPMESVLWVAPLISLGLVLAWAVGGALNMLDLGDDSSQALGAGVLRTRIVALLAVALLCGPATALAGPIAFVGFAVPHLVRMVIGNDTKQVIRFSALAAPSMLLLCDIAGRLAGSGAEIQAGVVTSLFGALALVILVLRSSSRKLS
ncbi:FecCD family ABC transporter permease [Glutamicibacter sp. NPDC087344]|uniref:FecCD family ABC transporter permease n=1 Tax=Glutamicibacter sp. NPDC087344 TaxID=3363994 RepID=UPI00382E5EC6